MTQVVPEVYDPETDRTVALENARKTFPLYPQAKVVQTGPGEDDWVVCTMGGTDGCVIQCHLEGTGSSAPSASRPGA